MLQVQSLSLQGKPDRAPIQFNRSGLNVEVRVSFLPAPVHIIKPTDLWGDILNTVLPLLYGEPDQFGKFDCTDKDIQNLTRNIDRLF